MLFPLVESLLPEEILQTWQRAMTTSSDAFITSITAKDRLTHLMTFLGKEVENEERIQITSDDSTRNKSKVKPKKDQDVATAAGLLSIKDTSVSKCIFCEESHNSLHCEKARNMFLDQRLVVVKK